MSTDWQLKVVDRDGNLQGSAVVVSPHHAITCAHVVRNAVLAGGGAGPGPGSFVYLELPRSRGHALEGTVVEGGWWYKEESPWDVAVLSLSSPLEVEPVPLARPGSLREGRRVSVSGFTHAEYGRWVTGHLRRAGGSRPDYVQFDIRQDSAFQVMRGYSGGGVIDETDVLLGITVEAARDGTAGWLIPVDTIPRVWEKAFSEGSGRKPPPIPGPSPVMTGLGYHRLPPAVRGDLVDALCEVDCVGEEQRQRRFLKYLPRQASRYARPGAHDLFAEGLVEYAEKHFSFLGLTRWLLDRESGSGPARAFAYLADELVQEEETDLLAPLLPLAAHDDLDTVRRELSRVLCADKGREVYEQTRNEARVPNSLPRPVHLWDALIDMAQIPTVDTNSPARVLCTRIAQRYSELVCADLLAEWGSPEPPGTGTTGSVTSIPARLVVRIERGAGRNRFDLDSRSVLSPRPGEPPDFLSRWIAGDVQAEEIPTRVGDWLDLLETDPRSHHHTSRRVEIVTSLELMADLDVGTWQSREVAGSEAIGARAEVVYRATDVVDRGERSARDARKRADERWSVLERERQAFALDLFREDGMNERLLHRHLGNEKVICLSIPGGLERRFMSVSHALGVGVPVVVWHCGTRERSISDWLNPVRPDREVTLTADQVHGLPATLLGSRTGVTSPKDDLRIDDGFEVAVMYHDLLPVLPRHLTRISPDSIR